MNSIMYGAFSEELLAGAVRCSQRGPVFERTIMLRTTTAVERTIDQLLCVWVGCALTHALTELGWASAREWTGRDNGSQLESVNERDCV